MPLLFLQAYLQLLFAEVYLLRHDFHGLYERVRKYPVRPAIPDADAAGRLSGAMDLACIWCWRQALCLQRSAALTCLLRRHGVRANMVIGAQQMPFRSHAWVEVNGLVVNDKPYVSEVFAILDRC